MGCDSPRPGRLVTLVRLGLAADLVELSVALATAFLNDPMMVWIGGDRDDEARRAAMAPGSFLPALQAGIRRGHTNSTADQGGAAIWSPPDTKIFDDIIGAMFGEAMSRHLGAEAIARTIELGQLVSKHHPYDVSHFYLFVLGTSTQGRSVGGELLLPVLHRCDADGLPAYLESSNSRNVGFYERHGFEVQWEERPNDDGLLLRACGATPSAETSVAGMVTTSLVQRG